MTSCWVVSSISLHPVDVEGGLRLDLRHGLRRDLAQLGPRPRRRPSPPEPGRHAGLVGPDGRHLGSGVALDHRAPPSPSPAPRQCPAPAPARQSRPPARTRAGSSPPGWPALRAPLMATRGHRHAGRHLHHGEQRVEPAQVGGADGHPDHRQVGHGRHHSRQRRRLARSGDDHLEPRASAPSAYSRTASGSRWAESTLTS